MASLLGFLGALGNSAGIGDQSDPNALQRLNNVADPAAALERQQALAGQNALAALAQNRSQGITNPQQNLNTLAQYLPQFTQSAAENQARNPLAAAFGNFTPGGQPAQPPAPGQVPTQGQPEDPYILKPEGPDDKRNYVFLNTQVPPMYRATLRAISNGDESVGNADSLRSNGLLALATIFDTSLSKSDFAARQATAKAASPAGKIGQFITSANTGTKHLAQVALDSVDLHNKDALASNFFRNMYSQYWEGKDPTTNFQSDVNTVAPELDKAASGGNDTTVSGTEAQKQSFDVNSSPQQLLGAAAGKATLIQSKADEVGKTYKNNMGGRSLKTLSEENQQTLEDLKQLHNYSKEDKLSDPKAQAIISRLRSIVGQKPEAQNSTPQGDISAKIAKAKQAGYSDEEIQKYINKAKAK